MEDEPKMMPEMISGPATLEQFLEMEEQVSIRDLMMAQDQLVEIEDALGEGKVSEAGVAFLRGYLTGIVEDSENKEHELELARSGLKIGNKNLALEILDQRIKFYDNLEAMMNDQGMKDQLTELRNIKQTLVMLYEDQVE